MSLLRILCPGLQPAALPGLVWGLGGPAEPRAGAEQMMALRALAWLFLTRWLLPTVTVPLVKAGRAASPSSSLPHGADSICLLRPVPLQPQGCVCWQLTS